MNRWLPFLIGITLSVALTAGLWIAGLPGFAFFLLFPLLLWPRRGPDRAVRPRCAACGYEARAGNEAYCPRDGSALN